MDIWKFFHEVPKLLVELEVRLLKIEYEVYGSDLLPSFITRM